MTNTYNLKTIELWDYKDDYDNPLEQGGRE